MRGPRSAAVPAGLPTAPTVGGPVPAPRPIVGRTPFDILLVEPSGGRARTLQEMLREGWGDVCAVVRVPNLREARARIQDGRWCVLLDLALPDATGLDALAGVLDAAPDATVIALARAGDDDGGRRAVQHGAEDYLLKEEVNATTLGRAIRSSVERKSLELELAHRAMHDALTGLPNRALLRDRLRQVLAKAERRPTAVAVLALDIDRFRLVNEGYGATAGDRLMRTVGARLRWGLRPSDTVARPGDDEFVVVVDDIESTEAALRIADRVARLVRAPVRLERGVVHATASVGVAISTGAEDQDTLLGQAAAALDLAKERGRDRIQLFEDGLAERALARLETEAVLRRGIERDQLRVHYQPIVRVADGALHGIEALVRWEHPDRGLLLPAEFLPVAEESGLIVPLGESVLRTACRDFARIHAATGRALDMVAVNLSARQLARPALAERVREILLDTGLHPSRLWLEITEGVVLDDSGVTAANLDALKGIGAHLSFDDFGTGYSSLRHLKGLPVDALKIDRSFVSGLGMDPDDDAIVEGIVSLARSLDMRVVAEGVETEDQLHTLRDLRCEFAQGFHLAPPQPLDELLRTIDRPALDPMSGTAAVR